MERFNSLEHYSDSGAQMDPKEYPMMAMFWIGLIIMISGLSSVSGHDSCPSIEGYCFVRQHGDILESNPHYVLAGFFYKRKNVECGEVMNHPDLNRNISYGLVCNVGDKFDFDIKKGGIHFVE